MIANFTTKLSQNTQKYLTIYRSSQYKDWHIKNSFQTNGNYYFGISFLTILVMVLTILKLKETCAALHCQILVFAITPFSFLLLPFMFFNFKNRISENTFRVISECFWFVTQTIQQYYLLSFYENQIAFGLILLAYTWFYRNAYIKFLSFSSLIVARLFFFINGYEIFINYLILIILIFGRELEHINQFLNFNQIFNFLDIIPEAMCIFDKKSQNLIYTNSQFEQLASKLTNQENRDLDFKVYQEFLTNLQLEEIQNGGFQINEQISQVNDEGITDDIYKIKKVFFSKDKQDSPGLQSSPFQVSQSQNSPTLECKQKNKINNNFTFLKKNQQSEQILKKAFTSEITLLLELHHQPINFIQSAAKKMRKISMTGLKQDNKNQSNKNILIPESRNSNISDDLLLSVSPMKNQKSIGNIQLDSSPISSFVEHKMKFMIHIMENFQFCENDDLQIVFLQDLSQLVLKTQVKKLEQVKKNLMRSISHDLVTYLNGAYGHLCQAKELLAQSKDAQLSQCIKQAFQYLTLQLYKISDFQDFQNILNGQLAVQNTSFNLNEAVDYCIDLILNQIEEKKLYIKVECLEEKILVQGDKAKFIQVLLNLISNSIRFTYQGGITFRIQVDSTLKLVEIRIIDTGVGMAQEQLGLLTKKLLMNDDNEKVSKDSVGIGMGLIVCKSILRMIGPSHMNILFFESKINQGSQVYFYLRLISYGITSLERSMEHEIPDNHIQLIKSTNFQQMNYKKLKVATPIQSFRKKVKMTKNNIYQGIDHSLSNNLECLCKNVLIVDDELFNLSILGLLIKQLGFTYDQAFNGAEAISCFKQRIQNKCCSGCCIYRLIFMDINMPVMDGWEAVKQMRCIEIEQSVKRIPIIAVTGFSSAKDRRKSLFEGFDVVINKPATKQKLEDIIDQLKIKK